VDWDREAIDKGFEEDFITFAVLQLYREAVSWW
jgi:hypothetical protein